MYRYYAPLLCVSDLTLCVVMLSVVKLCYYIGLITNSPRRGNRYIIVRIHFTKFSVNIAETKMLFNQNVRKHISLKNNYSILF